MLQESYIEWRLLLPTLPGTLAATKFDAYLHLRYKAISDTLQRVRGGGELVKTEELALDPQLGEKIAEIAKANRPGGIVTS